MATKDLMILIYACVAAFLALTNLFGIILDADSKGKFIAIQWGMLVISGILFLIERGINSL